MQPVVSDYMTDVVKILQSGQPVNIQPKGTSMYPLIMEQRSDRLTIVPIADAGGISAIKRGDILLYRSEYFKGLIVHRLVRVDRDNNFYFCGDNQQMIEGPVSADSLYGVVTEITRKGKTFPVSNLIYRFYSFVWTRTIGFRRVFRPMVTRIHKLFSRT